MDIHPGLMLDTSELIQLLKQQIKDQRHQHQEEKALMQQQMKDQLSLYTAALEKRVPLHHKWPHLVSHHLGQDSAPAWEPTAQTGNAFEPKITILS